MLNADSTIDKFLLEKRADNTLMNVIKALDQNGLQTVKRLIEELSPSANALKGILVLADEISFRDKKRISEIISDTEVGAILEQEKISKKEKLKKIRNYFEKIRFPEKSQIESQIEEINSSLKSEFNLKVNVPEDLEGDQVSVTIVGRNPDDFKRGAEKLQKFSDSQKLSSLFSILKGEW